jgi:acyl-CoA thioester hydrolase
VTERRLDIRWRDLDSSGHVNNAVYLSYLEESRTAWLEERLGSRERAAGFVLARVAIDYRRELKLEDEAVLVSCRLRRLGTSSVHTVEVVRTVGGDLAAEAEAVLVGPRPLAEADRRALEAG